MTRRPTKIERRQERVVLLATGVDAAMTGVIITAALATASLSLLGEAFRSVFLVALQFYALYVLLSLNRGRFDRFEYGTGKLEQTVWVALGAGLLTGSFWMVDLIFEVAFGLREAAQPLGLTIAALVNAINLLVNYGSHRVMRRYLRDGGSLLFVAHLKVREAMFLGSVGLQCTLTAAALARDAEVALVFDILGAAFLVILKFRRGIKVMARALPNLLDASASEDKHLRIAQIARSLLPADESVDIRTRLNGKAIEVEIEVAGATCRSAADLCRWTTTIESALLAEGLHVDVAVILSKIDGAQGPKSAFEH